MKTKSNFVTTILASAGMLILILDSKLVLQSAAEGIDLCLKSLIPALFPFLVLSGILTGCICLNKNKKANKFTKLLGIPSGAEHLLLLGFLGGYPNGAQNVHNYYEQKMISRKDAERLLPICNQAGPAFIFGILPCLFSSAWIPFMLWIIQIASALITAAILPYKSEAIARCHGTTNKTVTAALQSAVRTMGWICGWVILFRIMIRFLENRILGFFPKTIQVMLTGFLELSNGLLELRNIQGQYVRFNFASILLSLGGFCVLLQTKSIIKELNLNIYLLGKGSQVIISMILSLLTYPLLFNEGSVNILHWLFCSAIVVIFIVILKKTVAISNKMLYNEKKSESEVLT